MARPGGSGEGRRGGWMGCEAQATWKVQDEEAARSGASATQTQACSFCVKTTTKLSICRLSTFAADQRVPTYHLPHQRQQRPHRVAHTASRRGQRSQRRRPSPAVILLRLLWVLWVLWVLRATPVLPRRRLERYRPCCSPRGGPLAPSSSTGGSPCPSACPCPSCSPLPRRCPRCCGRCCCGLGSSRGCSCAAKDVRVQHACASVPVIQLHEDPCTGVGVRDGWLRVTVLSEQVCGGAVATGGSGCREQRWSQQHLGHQSG